MAGRQITIKRLEAIIASYGSDPARWPEAERQGARTVLEGGEGGAVLRDAARLDALLERAERSQPSNMLKANLLEGAAKSLTSQIASTSVHQSPWTMRLAGMIDVFARLKPLALGSMMAPVLALGIWIGASLTSEPLGEDEIFAAFGEDYELWTENEPSPLAEETGET